MGRDEATSRSQRTHSKQQRMAFKLLIGLGSGYAEGGSANAAVALSGVRSGRGVDSAIGAFPMTRSRIPHSGT